MLAAESGDVFKDRTVAAAAGRVHEQGARSVVLMIEYQILAVSWLGFMPYEAFCV